MSPTTRWAILWRQKNLLDGEQRYFLWNGTYPTLFRTRRAARDHIQLVYGYIGRRPDLQQEPHGWRVPIPVKVHVSLTPA